LDKLEKKTDHNVCHHVAKYGSDDGMHGHHHHLGNGGAKIHGRDRYNTLDHYHPLYNLGYWDHTKGHHLDKLEKKTDHNVRHHHLGNGGDDGIHGRHHHVMQFQPQPLVHVNNNSQDIDNTLHHF